MTAPNATVALHLRRPDGTRLNEADAARMLPGTTLVVAIDAGTGDGQMIATVIGWAVPEAAKHARPMLAAVVKTANTAADMSDQVDDSSIVRIVCGRPMEDVDIDAGGVCRSCGSPAEAHRTLADIEQGAGQ